MIPGLATPRHSDRLAVGFTVGVGFTVIVNERGTPGQPLAVGVTVMVAVTGVVPVLVAVKEPMFPLPLAPKPMDVLLLVQAKVLPGTGPAKFTAAVGAPLHNVWLPTGVTVGRGFTVIVYVAGVPEQPLAEGVTVMVEVMGAVLGLAAVNAGTVLLPDATRPVAVVLLVQL